MRNPLRGDGFGLSDTTLQAIGSSALCLLGARAAAYFGWTGVEYACDICLTGWFAFGIATASIRRGVRHAISDSARVAKPQTPPASPKIFVPRSGASTGS